MREETKEKFTRGVILALLVAILAAGSFAIYPTYRRGQALQAKNEHLQVQIDQKKREIATLQEYQKRFRDDVDFIETIARQNRRVFPGELVFVFEDD